MKNIILAGFKCCGKTTFGNQLAQHFDLPFIDTNQMVHALYFSKHGEHLSTSEIYKYEGEDCLRSLEKMAIADASSRQGHIIEVGGESILDAENMAKLKETGCIVFLKADVETIVDNMMEQKPLLFPTILNPKDPLNSLQTVYSAHLPLYEAVADWVIDFSKQQRGEVSQNLNEIIQNHILSATTP